MQRCASPPDVQGRWLFAAPKDPVQPLVVVEVGARLSRGAFERLRGAHIGAHVDGQEPLAEFGSSDVEFRMPKLRKAWRGEKNNIRKA